MFLSLVRPERISSPVTSSAAVTCSGAVVEFAVAIDDPSAPGPTQRAIPTLPLWVMMLQVIRRGRPLPVEQVPRSRRGGPHAGGGRGGRQMPGSARLRPIAYAPPPVRCQPGRNGALHLRPSQGLAPHDPSLAPPFRAAVERNAAGPFLAERDGGGAWRKLTYAAARPLVDALAHSLIERGLSAERPVMILSTNGIDHALLTLAGHTAGVPVAPISVAYSLQSQDHAKLNHIAALPAPGLIYVADTGPFAKALAALDLKAEIVASRNGANVEGVTAFDQLAQGRPGPALGQAAAAIGA